MKIYIGADHGGYILKEEIKKWLTEWRYDFEDLGAKEFNPTDDYPDFAWPVATKVGSEFEAFGILVCRSGQGVCIVANKTKGSRAVVAWNEQSAYSARNDDDANILCLASDYTDVQNVKKIVETFLKTRFDNDERFVRRINKIKKIENDLK